MSKRLLAIIGVLVFLTGAADARRICPILCARPVSNAVPLSIDGSISNFTAVGTSLALSLSTTKSNDVVVVGISNGASGPTIGVVGSSLGAFTRRSRSATGIQNVEMWYAIAAAPLSSETITITDTTTGSIGATAFGVNGAKTSAPWDTNASLPKTTIVFGGTVTISTTAANTIVLGYFKNTSTVSPTPGAGFTAIAPLANSFMIAQQKIVSAPQTNLVISEGTGQGDTNGGTGDAIVQGP